MAMSAKEDPPPPRCAREIEWWRENQDNRKELLMRCGGGLNGVSCLKRAEGGASVRTRDDEMAVFRVWTSAATYRADSGSGDTETSSRYFLFFAISVNSVSTGG